MQLANKLVPELLVGKVFVRDPAEMNRHLEAKEDTGVTLSPIPFIGLEKSSIHSIEPARERFIRRTSLQIDTIRAVRTFIDHSRPGITEEQAIENLKSVYLKVIERLTKEDPLLAKALAASLHKDAHELSGRHVKGEHFVHPSANNNAELQTYKSIFLTALRLIKAHFACHRIPGQFERELNARLLSLGAKRSAADIEPKAFWTNVYLKPGSYRHQETLLGVWNGEICLILRGRTDKQSTPIREHEEIHARVGYSDEFRKCEAHPGESISKNLTRVSGKESCGASYTKVFDALNISPIQLLRMFKEELLAEFRTFVRNDRNRKVAAWKSFKTASEDCIKFCESIIRFTNGPGKALPELSNKALSVAQGLADIFEKTTLDIAKLAYVARRLGKQAVDVVEAGMLVLPPDKYHRIMDILSKKYGKEKVNSILRYYHSSHSFETEKLMDFATERATWKTKSRIGSFISGITRLINSLKN